MRKAEAGHVSCGCGSGSQTAGKADKHTHSHTHAQSAQVKQVLAPFSTEFPDSLQSITGMPQRKRSFTFGAYGG